MTLFQLYQSTKKLKSSLIVSSKAISVSNFNVTVDTRRGMKVFSAISKDEKGKTRRQVVMAFKPREGDDLADLTAFTPHMKTDDVMVNSGSPWYTFICQNANIKAGCHYGDVTRYKVKGTGRSANPRGIPSCDKHLLGFMRELLSSNLITQ